MAEVKAPVVSKYTKENYAALKNVAGKRIIEVAEIAAFDLAPETEGQQYKLKIATDPSIVTIDKPVGKDKEDGRILIITAVGRTEKGKKISFSMNAEQADSVKIGDSVIVVSTLIATTQRCRLNLEGLAA